MCNEDSVAAVSKGAAELAVGKVPKAIVVAVAAAATIGVGIPA